MVSARYRVVAPAGAVRRGWSSSAPSGDAGGREVLELRRRGRRWWRRRGGGLRAFTRRPAASGVDCATPPAARAARAAASRRRAHVAFAGEAVVVPQPRRRTSRPHSGSCGGQVHRQELIFGEVARRRRRERPSSMTIRSAGAQAAAAPPRPRDGRACGAAATAGARRPRRPEPDLGTLASRSRALLLAEGPRLPRLWSSATARASRRRRVRASISHRGSGGGERAPSARRPPAAASRLGARLQPRRRATAPARPGRRGRTGASTKTSPVAYGCVLLEGTPDA